MSLAALVVERLPISFAGLLTRALVYKSFICLIDGDVDVVYSMNFAP